MEKFACDEHVLEKFKDAALSRDIGELKAVILYIY